MLRSRKGIRLRRQLLWLLALLAAASGLRPLLAQPATALPLPAASRQPSFAAIDAIMEEAVAAGDTPGGVVLVGHNGKVVYRKAYLQLREQMRAYHVGGFFEGSICSALKLTHGAFRSMKQGGNMRLQMGKIVEGVNRPRTATVSFKRLRFESIVPRGGAWCASQIAFLASNARRLFSEPARCSAKWHAVL